MSDTTILDRLNLKYEQHK